MRRCVAGKLFREEPAKASLITCPLREEDEKWRYGKGAQGKLSHDQPFSRSSTKIARLRSERRRPLPWPGSGCRHVRALERSQMIPVVQSAVLTMPMQHDALACTERSTAIAHGEPHAVDCAIRRWRPVRPRPPRCANRCNNTRY